MDIDGVEVVRPLAVMGYYARPDRPSEMLFKNVRTSEVGKPLADPELTIGRIAESRVAIDQARLLTLNAAHRMHVVGNNAAKTELAVAKVAVPNMACEVRWERIVVSGSAALVVPRQRARHLGKLVSSKRRSRTFPLSKSSRPSCRDRERPRPAACSSKEPQ